LLSNVPLLRDDQTLYSWCGQVHDWSGGASATETSRALFGRPYAALCHDFPARLEHLASVAFEDSVGVDELALRRTLLGYFLTAAPPRLNRRILAAVSSSSLPSVKMTLGIAASRVGGHHPLKACVNCVEHDLQELGAAYWRVEHQAPSVLVCQGHARPLFVAWDPVTPVHRRHWLHPADCSKWTRIELRASTDEQLRLLMRLADISAKWMAVPPGSFNAVQLAECYRSRLRDRALATATGRLRVGLLADEIQRSCCCLQDLCDLEPLRGYTPAWAASVTAICRRRPRTAHPFRHLLVITLLFDSWEEFVRAYHTSNTMPKSTDPRATGAVVQPLGGRLRALVSERGLSVSAAARELGVTTNTALCIAQREGIPCARRPKKLRGTSLSSVRRMLANGRSLQSISRRTGLARVTLNRLLRGDAGLAEARRAKLFEVQRDIARAAFMSVLRRHPGAGIKQVRSFPGNRYSWLYRHDRSWLLEQSRQLLERR
jgi:transcriptional regulator with XRE-family HTH domain